MIDIYKGAPFYIDIDKTKPQILNKPVGIRFINDTQFELFTNFESDKATGQFYNNNSSKSISVPKGEFKKIFTIG